MSIKFHLTTKSSLLLFVVLKLWWVKKLNVHLPWAKTKKESFLESPFPLIKRKESFGRKLIYNLLDCRLKYFKNKNEWNDKSSTFRSVLITLMKNYCISSVGPPPSCCYVPRILDKSRILPFSPTYPPPKKKIFFPSVSKIYWPIHGNSFLTRACLKVFNLQIVVLTLINPWKSFSF